jgi:septal ring factor EnvC (AmiA/AmiB activator)
MSASLGQILVSASMGAVLVALINFVASRRKLGADAAAVLTKAAADLVEPLQRQIGALDADLERVRGKARVLENELDECRRINARKESQIAALRDEVRGLRRQITGVASQTQQLVDTNPNLRAVRRDENP